MLITSKTDFSIADIYSIITNKITVKNDNGNTQEISIKISENSPSFSIIDENPEEIEILLEKKKKISFEDQEDEIKLFQDDFEIFPCVIPLPDQHLSILVSGTSGSGKSTFISSFVKKYLTNNKNSKAIFILPTNDPAYNDIIGKRVKFLNIKNLFDMYIDHQSQKIETPFHETFSSDTGRVLIILDDIIATKEDKTLFSFIKKFETDLLLLSRKAKIDKIITKHTVIQSASEAIILNNYDSIFCSRENLQGNTKNAIIKYFDCPKEFITKIQKLKDASSKLGHWLFFQKKSKTLVSSNAIIKY